MKRFWAVFAIPPPEKKGKKVRESCSGDPAAELSMDGEEAVAWGDRQGAERHRRLGVCLGGGAGHMARSVAECALINGAGPA